MLVRHHAPEPRIECPTCRRSVEVSYEDRTNRHLVSEHPSGPIGQRRLTLCAGSSTPIAFLPERYAVVAVLWNRGLLYHRRLLAVSRKNDLSDFGLPGGKADPICPTCKAGLTPSAVAAKWCTQCGPIVPTMEDPYTAIVRETREETGILIAKATYVYWRKDYSQSGDTRPTIPALCFEVVEWSGEPVQMEAGRVAWVEPQVVLSGSFREYNTDLFKAIGVL